MRLVIFLFLLVANLNVVAANASDKEAEYLKSVLEPKSRPWKPPDYSNQSAIGYSSETFSTTPVFKEHVDFWIDIYSKYDTFQGVIHDSIHPAVVYEEIDLSGILKRTDISERKKRRLKSKLIKNEKKQIQKILKKLAKVKNPQNLSAKELKYWELFKNIKDRKKFIEASKMSRIRFQLGQRDQILRGIYYSGRYIERMEKIFEQNGLPKELTRIPFVESSFNYKARSKVGASGIWQFMRRTGKAYMRLTYAVDERNDPITATKAAARLLHTNYKVLGRWPLAVTAYNHGAYGMKKKMRKHKATTLDDLIDVRKGRFGFASANFYASFLAVLHVEANAKKYFENPLWDVPLDGVEVPIKRYLNAKSLVNWYDGNLEKAKEWNPHIGYRAWKGWVLMHPKDFVRIAHKREKDFLLALTKLPKQKPSLGKNRTYKIRRGDTIGVIARRFGVSQKALMAANGISNPRRIRGGQKLIIPNK